MYLEQINQTSDIRKLTIEQLRPLADETRAALIHKISKAGGHNGPNLGIVELTVALHYVFDTPNDKVVYDVSHQSYPHKILTGRKQAYTDEEHFHDVTGFTNPSESEHDLFKVGHTSTSISLALGLAKGRDVTGGHENVIALIGDGSLSGGEALEALDTAGEYDKNLIIIVNDNDQSIADNHGGIYKNLRELRQSNGTCTRNMFESFGLEYHYLDDGHDVEALVNLFNSVKDIDHPVVLHIHTIKGKGLKFAEENREAWHAGGPFNPEDGSRPEMPAGDTTVSDSIIDLLDNNPSAVVLNAGTPMGLGMVKGVREKYEQSGQFVDVGIAEENMVAMASGVARNGGTAVFGTFAPFLQRTYDQVSHDLSLNNNPATMLVLSAGAYGMNSDTHIALCDIQMFTSIANLVYLAPSTREEYKAMFAYATTQKEHPVGIRVPDVFLDGEADTTDYSVLKNKVVQNGHSVAIFAVGRLMEKALEVSKRIKEQTGTQITVINPLFLSGLDSELLESLKKDHQLVITLEDGELSGGYGVNIASYYGNSDMKVQNFGISKKFHSDFDAEKLLADHGMSVEHLCEVITKSL